MAKDNARVAKAERERLYRYQARQQLHAARATRRTRDSVLASIIGSLAIAGVIAGQTLYFTVGPGAADEIPTPAPTIAVTDEPADPADPLSGDEETIVPDVQPMNTPTEDDAE